MSSAAHRREWARKNPAKVNEYQRRYRAKNRDKVAAWNKRSIAAQYRKDPLFRVRAALRKRYGLTPEALAAMDAAQGGLCAVCRKVPPQHTDHDHATNQRRGRLCQSCNHMLGMAKDDPATLRAAAVYVEHYCAA